MYKYFIYKGRYLILELVILIWYESLIKLKMTIEHIPYEEVKRVTCENRTLKLIKKADLTNNQKEKITEFFNALRLGNKIHYIFEGNSVILTPKSYNTFENYIRAIVRFAVFIKKDLTKIKKYDIEKFQLELQTKVNSKTGKRLKPKSVEQHSINMKVFFIWLYNGQEQPAMVQDIIRKRSVIEPIKDTEVLKPKEIKAMIDTCLNKRDKAILSLMFETGCRVGELVSCNIDDFINFGRYAKIRLNGKTGIRTIAVSDCVVYIEQWLNEHPFNTESTAPLFISTSSNSLKLRLTPQGVSGILGRAGESANITKKYNPHWFRHSGLTHYTNKYHANERDLKIRAGWCESSNMHLRYIHYGEDEVNLNYLKAKGISVENHNTKDDKLLDPKICNRCSELYPKDSTKWIHPPTAKYCHCGQVLDVTILKKIENLQKDANKFTEVLLKQPIPNGIDLTQGTTKALFESIKENPLLADNFKDILEAHNLV